MEIRFNFTMPTVTFAIFYLVILFLPPSLLFPPTIPLTTQDDTPQLTTTDLGFETITVNYGTDIPNLRGSHKRYLYGPGSILVAHSDHEHLNYDDLRAAVAGYKTLIRHALTS